jgi:hypothetical protein
VLASVVQVEIHLAGVRVGEAAEFQIYENQAAQSAMEKK